jgi:hypothetical protein
MKCWFQLIQKPNLQRTSSFFPSRLFELFKQFENHGYISNPGYFGIFFGGKTIVINPKKKHLVRYLWRGNFLYLPNTGIHYILGGSQ